MTKPQEKMLLNIANGADPNTAAQISQLLGGRKATGFARTMMALVRAGMLGYAKAGGLELSEKGRAAAAKIAARKNGAKRS